EAGRVVGVAADGGEDGGMALGGGDDAGVGALVEADVEDAPHPRRGGRREQLAFVPVAEEEVGVGVDHRRRPAYPRTAPTAWPSPRGPGGVGRRGPTRFAAGAGRGTEGASRPLAPRPVGMRLSRPWGSCSRAAARALSGCRAAARRSSPA